jgi:predicted  nucleic acid-binding Zn-ribbon protein
MTKTIKEQMRNLEQLQELDLKIQNLKKSQGELPLVLKSLDDAMAKVQNNINLKKNTIVDLEKIKGQTSAALDLNRDRLARSTGRLEGVQNTQEFQAINKEVDQLKKLAVNLEEQSKKTNTDMDNLQKELTVLDEEYLKLKTERDAQASQVTGQSTKFDTEISTLVGERTQFTSLIDKRVLSQYDRIRGARGGLGIVPAIAGRCKGCNMVVPPQLYNEIQRGNDVHQCPSCHRILFIPNPVATAADSSGQRTSA